MTPPHPASQMIAAVAGDPNYFCTFFATADSSASKVQPQNICGTLAECMPRLEKLNKAGAGIFLTVQLTKGLRRRSEDVTDLRALFVDLDDVPQPEAWICPPTYTHSRSAARSAAFWGLAAGEDMHRFRGAQVALACYYRSDPSVIDLARVMRLPGFDHCKSMEKREKYTVQICEPARIYTIDEVLTAHGIDPRSITPEKPAPAQAPIDLSHEITDQERKNLIDRLQALKGDVHHKPMYRWVCDAVQACLPEDELIPMVENWFVEKGREARDGEVEQLYNDAVKKVKEGKAYISMPGIRADLDFSDVPAPGTPPSRPEALSEEQAKVQTAKMIKWSDALLLNEKGNRKDCEFNYLHILTKHEKFVDEPLLRYNTFTDKVELARNPPWKRSPHSTKEWNPSDDGQLLAWLQNMCEIAGSAAKVQREILPAAERNPFHPICAYLDTLVWDKKPRLDTWLIDTMSAPDTPYVRRVSACTLIAAVARVRRPGCKVDTVLILEGIQGTKKSTALRILAGTDYFSDADIDIADKDSASILAGNWIFELGELDALKRADVTRLKSWCSRQTDRLRKPYDRLVSNIPRQGVVIGSTNNSSYLKDETGNRRFWPVKTGAINLPLMTEIRDQIWAEAQARFAAEEQWWLDQEHETMAKAEQAERLSPDPWCPAIQEWLAAQTSMGGPAVTRVTGRQIARDALQISDARMSQADMNRIGNVLRRLGWCNAVRREGAAVVREYHLPGANP